MNKEYIGAIIDTCEDVIGSRGYLKKLDGMPEVVFEDGRYDALAADVETALSLASLSVPGCKADGDMTALDAVSALATSQCIAVAALRVLDGIVPVCASQDAFGDLLEETAGQVAKTIIEWIKTKEE